MKQLTIEVTERTEVGTGPVNRLRRAGRVPGVVYGEERSPVSLSVDSRSFQRQVVNSRGTQLFKLESKNAELNGLVVLVKEMQFEPLKDRVLHVDFYAIREGHKITVAVPLEIIGECPSVKAGEAILNQTAYEIELECLPTEIPESIKIDVTELVAGHSIHAGDIQLPSGSVLKSDADLSIVGALLKKEEEAPAVAAPAEGEAAAAAAPAEGEAAKKSE